MREGGRYASLYINVKSAFKVCTIYRQISTKCLVGYVVNGAVSVLNLYNTKEKGVRGETFNN